jgi:guanylate kinase
MKKLAVPGEYIVTATTRPKRPGETDGRDYCFYGQSEFEAMIEAGQLLEQACVYGNYYGVPLPPVEAAIDKGSDVFIKVDVQGAKTIRDKLPGSLLVFIEPPSYEELKRRLEKRLTESAEALKRRLAAASREMEQLPLFDCSVVNDSLDKAVAEIMNIVAAEKRRRSS